jgi:hypothetical protein
VSREVWSALGEPTVNRTSRISCQPPKAPAALLGREHPFVRATDRLASVAYACVAVSAALLSATAALVAGSSSALAIVVAAALADVLLVCWAGMLIGTRRAHALDLICRGHDDLPIPVVKRLAAHLSSPRYRERLVRSLEQLVDPEVRLFDVATLPWRFLPADLVEPVRRELDQIARLLRNPDASVQGVALLRALLVDGTSSLHGDDVRVLREDLARIRFLLEAG